MASQSLAMTSDMLFLRRFIGESETKFFDKFVEKLSFSNSVEHHFYGLNMVAFTLDLAGQRWDVDIPSEELESVHLPLVKDMIRKAMTQKERVLVFLAGPPGSGKTTLGALWELLARERDFQVNVQTLPMDGFHFPNAELDARTILRKGERCSLRRLKGSPESYDLPMLTRTLHDVCEGRELTWPKYDRSIHDPVPDAIPVIPTGVLIIEGNYLLLDEPGWRDLTHMADLTIFIECDEALVRQDVLARAQRGGRSHQDAIQHYEFNDQPNRERIMQHRLESDIVLRIEAGRRVTRVK
jgi:pantothenate kinase